MFGWEKNRIKYYNLKEPKKPKKLLIKVFKGSKIIGYEKPSVDGKWLSMLESEGEWRYGRNSSLLKETLKREKCIAAEV